ncbi:MAG: N-acetylmuramoyl-L-alanine amidase [Muribaculaceae bacterium]|nr:N-acetylmuramoyl-L-alanine amidase [Muribaculaceae bacterium]
MKNTNSFKTIIFFLFCLFLPQFAIAKEDVQKTFTIVIDAGHGGKDIGAADNGAREKDINLGVALQLEKIIKKQLKDVKVIMTRSDDTYLTLQQRADIANKSKGDLFISIHTNSVDKNNKNRKTVAGSSVYALGLHKDDNNMKVAQRENSVIELESNFEQKYKGFDPNKDESYIIFEMAQKKNLTKSLKFADEVQKELVGIGRANRGVHQAGFWVLWATSMPAVLIELDFICNPNSAKYMTSAKGEEEFAGAIFKAVDNYYKTWKKSSSSVSAVNNESSSPQKRVADKTPGFAVKASSSVKKDKKHLASGERKHSSTRRRRNDASREASVNRDVETSSIPLHKEGERSGIRVAVGSDETLASANSTSLSEKERKRLEKLAKKERKEREKQKKLEEKRKRKANAHNAKRGKIVTVYKIQILASADLLKQNNPRFCGLSPISTYKENNLYKYYYGESLDRSEMEALLKDVRKKIPDAFVVASTKSSH